MAERVRFEPTIPVKVCPLSSRPGASPGWVAVFDRGCLRVKKTFISLFRINAGDRASGLGPNPKKQPDGSDGTALPGFGDWVSDYRCGLVPYVFDISLA
jgi:hypothetical protein